MQLPIEILEQIANNSLASLSSFDLWNESLPNFLQDYIHRNLGIIVVNNTVDAYALDKTDYDQTTSYLTFDDRIECGQIKLQQTWNGSIPKFNHYRATNDSNLLIINTVFSDSKSYHLQYIIDVFLKKYKSVVIYVKSDKHFSNILEFTLNTVAKALFSNPMPISIIFETQRNYISKLYFKAFQRFLSQDLLIELHIVGDSLSSTTNLFSIDLELMFCDTFFYNIPYLYSLQMSTSLITSNFDKQPKRLHSNDLKVVNFLEINVDRESNCGDFHFLRKNLKIENILDLQVLFSDVPNFVKIVNFGLNNLTLPKTNHENIIYSVKYEKQFEKNWYRIILPDCDSVGLKVSALRDYIFMDGKNVTKELILQNNKIIKSTNFLSDNKVAHKKIEAIRICNCFFPNIKKLSILQQFWTKDSIFATDYVIWENNNFRNVNSFKINSPIMDSFLNVELPSLKCVTLQYHSYKNLSKTLEKLCSISFLETLTLEKTETSFFDVNLNQNEESMNLSNCSVILPFVKISKLVFLIKSNSDFEFFIHGLDMTKWIDSNISIKVIIASNYFDFQTEHYPNQNVCCENSDLHFQKKVSRKCNLDFATFESCSEKDYGSLDDVSFLRLETSTSSDNNYKELNVMICKENNLPFETTSLNQKSENTNYVTSSAVSSMPASPTSLKNQRRIALDNNIPVNPSMFSKYRNNGHDISSARRLSMVENIPMYEASKPFYGKDDDTNIYSTHVVPVNNLATLNLVPRIFTQENDNFVNSSNIYSKQNTLRKTNTGFKNASTNKKMHINIQYI